MGGGWWSYGEGWRASRVAVATEKWVCWTAVKLLVGYFFATGWLLVRHLFDVVCSNNTHIRHFLLPVNYYNHMLVRTVVALPFCVSG